jgi:hypothetical protein
VTGFVTSSYPSKFFIVAWAVSLAGLGASLAINAHQTLKLLALRAAIRDNCDPLCGLGRELRFIAGNNILKELKLDLLVDSVDSCRTESEDWSTFDSVMTESGAFPMLHRVSVRIWWGLTDAVVVDHEPEDGIWRSFKEDNFPRLAKSKAVEFNFSVQIYIYHRRP